jgi:AraC-like DNA-binding protein
MGEVISDTSMSLPHEVLRPFIVRYVGYRLSGLPGGFHIGLPSGSVRLFISLSKPIEVIQMPNPVQRPFASHALVSGLQDRPAVVRQNVDEFGLNIFVKPFGVRAILGVSSAEISTLALSLDELWGNDADNLVSELILAKHWDERFAILDRVFVSRLRPARPSSEISWSWDRLIQSRGTLRVTRLADLVGYSRRYFGQQFKNQTGISPKSAARLLRFEHACNLIAHRGMSLVEVAMACGYFDQAHLTRDWYALAGCSPRAWAIREVRFLQDYESEYSENDCSDGFTGHRSLYS